MKRDFVYCPSNSKSVSWKVTYDISDNKYRNYVSLRQSTPSVPFKKAIPLIMLNPGSFTDEKTFGRDTTLRNVRNAFLDSGFEIEILNLFNVCEVDLKKLQKMDFSKRNNYNPIKNKLDSYHDGDKVIIQWGKLDDYDFAKIRSEEILDYIKNKGLKYIGLKSEKGYYFHPRYWSFIKGADRFKEEIIPLI